MRVLVLSPYPERLAPCFASAGDAVESCGGPLPGDLFSRHNFGAIVSYGYRDLIREPLLGAFAGRIFNLHISLLPWNRGADPNFWSWFEGTPKGVSIHLVDRGVDTGPIVAQSEVAFTGGETLRTSHDRLMGAMDALFAETWPRLKSGAFAAKPQPPGGSVHRRHDKDEFLQHFPTGWDTPVSAIMERGAELRMSAAFCDKSDREMQAQI